MASRTKLVLNALTSIAFYAVIIWLFVSIYSGIRITSYDEIAKLSAVITWAICVGFFILYFTTSIPGKGIFGDEEELEWMTYKFIPYLAYGIIGFVVVFGILDGVSHGSSFGGRRRR